MELARGGETAKDMQQWHSPVTALCANKHEEYPRVSNEKNNACTEVGPHFR